MTTIEVTITVLNEETKEELVALLSNIFYDAFEEDGLQLKAFIKEEHFDEEALRQLLEPYKATYATMAIQEQNWNEVWESNFAPVVVGDFCAIRAHFHPPFTNVQHEIIITPKMSFGTGHHATTYMMIDQMSGIDFKDRSVADFGTGTGVLAILAEKLGSSYVWAIDYDDWSINNAKG